MAFSKVEISRSAVKDLRGIDRSWIPKIIAAAEALEFNPRPPESRKLVGSKHTYRLRIGDYRMIYHIQTEPRILLVTRIRHRRDVYR